MWGREIYVEFGVFKNTTFSQNWKYHPNNISCFYLLEKSLSNIGTKHKSCQICGLKTGFKFKFKKLVKFWKQITKIQWPNRSLSIDHRFWKIVGKHLALLSKIVSSGGVQPTQPATTQSNYFGSRTRVSTFKNPTLASQLQSHTPKPMKPNLIEKHQVQWF